SVESCWRPHRREPGRSPTSVACESCWALTGARSVNHQTALGAGGGWLMDERRRWKRLGWEGPLLLVGALAAGLAVAAGSCDGSDSRSGAVGKIPTGTGSLPCVSGG